MFPTYEYLNNLIQETEFEAEDLDHIVMKAPAGPLFNNAAQVWNHTFYWNCLSPTGGGEPSGDLAEAISQRMARARRRSGLISIGTW